MQNNWLDDLLEEMGWTPSDLARECDLDTAVISNIKNGRRKIGIDVAKKIARGTRKSEYEILVRAGLVEPNESSQDRWVRSLERKLELITDERDREIIEQTIDILAPDKKTRARRRAPNEGSS